MRKVTLILSIFFLLIFTTITKNSTKKIEKQIYNTKENLRILEQRYEMVLLDNNYLSSPERLMEYQFRFFENELSEIDIMDLKRLTIFEKRIELKKFVEQEWMKRN